MTDDELVQVAARVIDLLKNGSDPNSPPGAESKGIHPRSIQAQASLEPAVEAAPVVPASSEPTQSVWTGTPPATLDEGPLFWGAAGAATLYLAAPFVRPALRGAVKGGFRLKRVAEEAAAEAREDLEDLVAQISAEMSESSQQ